MSDEAPAPLLRIVRGDPTPEELAALLAVLGVFHGAAGPLLGLPLLVDLTEGVDSDEDFDDDSVLSLQFWVVAPERDRDTYLSSALRIVDDAGTDVVRRLEEAGFTVASYASGLDEDGYDDEDDDL